LWVDINQMTNIPGLFAAGEAEYQYHGANRLGANSLLSCIYGGMVTGPNAVHWAKGLKKPTDALSSTIFDESRKREEQKFEGILKMDGDENPYQIHRELGQIMTDNVTVVRQNDRLKKADEQIVALMERYKRIGVTDKSRWENQMAQFTRHLWNMLELSRVVTIGALNRDESRGAHYKPAFPERDDENWLKTTKAKWTPGGPAFEYESVDISLIPPRKRNYAVSKEASEK
jgi:succinate dehydrogenase / fumarate reductase flavoprotein subunit